MYRRLCFEFLLRVKGARKEGIVSTGREAVLQEGVDWLDDQLNGDAEFGHLIERLLNKVGDKLVADANHNVQTILLSIDGLLSQADINWDSLKELE